MLTIGEEGTREVARALAQIVVPADCIALHGDLGAGKTCFAEAFIRQLHGGDVGVISPTYTLLQTYDVSLLGAPATVWHYDLYRLESPEELHELALDEALEEGISLIEWPEIASALLPAHCIHVTIEFAESADNRNISVRSSPANLSRLQRAGLC